ncbi:hypothetical protein AA313_de0206340 [Arthrobotrys entomopaga]|nr:hypothetical protein AA313_de0206340 [Arthrobotrys entomopaga]
MQHPPTSHNTIMSLSSLPSEILLLILSHLNLKDVFAFLRTCKALYPISHRHLWSTLHLCDRIPNKYKGPPCHPFVHNPANAIGNDGCKALARAIREFDGGKLGFGYIRGLALEPEVFNRSTACMSDGLLKVLGDKISEGEIPVRWVKVSVWDKFLETSDDPPTGAERFLKILKNYSETKSTNEFSIILDTNFISSISAWFSPKCSIFDLIDMEKITSLDLEMDVYEGGFICQHGAWFDENDPSTADGEEPGEPEEPEGGDEPSGTEEIPTYTGAGTEQIKDLTRLLTETVNLRVFKLYVDWDVGLIFPPIYTMAPLLNPLQSAISRLRTLEWLYLRGLIFHPSFFLTPPKNVRKFQMKCSVSKSWWMKFAKSPLIGVREFTVWNRRMVMETQPDGGEYGSLWGNDVLDQFYDFPVGEVAVEGLKRFWVQEGYVPLDLIECIERKNRGVEIIDSRGDKMAALNLKLQKLVPAQH